jgi:branched-chain amino acid aminotransferase
MNGSLVDWKDATIHVASHVIHYGSGVFEGARCYQTKQGSACFRLTEHVDRLIASAKIYRMDLPYTRDMLSDAILDTIRANNYKACYIRPLVYRGYDTLGVNPSKCPVDIAILTWEWGKYLGDEALEQGVDVKISSWTRIAPNTLPTLAKSSANYANSALMKMEAVADGYAEAIALDVFGHVSEGSGENLFVVRNGVIHTPPLSASVLPGITRDSVLTLARELGYTVREENIARELLYIADELFFTGTAVEITPVRSVDRQVVGTGRRGPITEAIQRAFFGIVTGERPDTHGWLTPVYTDRATAAEAANAAAAVKGR